MLTSEYYKVAAPGKACHKGNTTDCLEARDIDRTREKIATAQRAATRMDILILIDATDSMEQYLPSTVSAIQHFVKEAGDTGEDRSTLGSASAFMAATVPRFRACSTVDFNSVVQFFRATPSTVGPTGPLGVLVTKPQALLFKDDIHRDKLEAPFAAVIRATKEAKWRRAEEVPLRFIIHLADDGNRDKGKTSGETVLARFPGEKTSHSSLREVYGETDVVEALRKHGVIYVPVAVLGGGQHKGTVPVGNRIFQEQMNRILALMGDRSPITKIEVTYSDESIETLQERVAKTVGVILGVSVLTMQKISARLEYEAECGTGVKTKGCRELEEMISIPAIIKLADEVAAKAAGLTAEERLNIYSRDQSIVTLYAPAKSREGRDTFTHWVVLEQQEFKLLRNVLKSLCQEMGKQDGANPVVKALREITGLYADEEFSELIPAEFLNKKLGIPNLERTDFSGRTRDEIEDAFEDWRRGGGAADLGELG